MRVRKTWIPWLLVYAFLLAFPAPAAHAQDKPNIVLVFMDNFGWGEPGFNGGGIIRGAATPSPTSTSRSSARRRVRPS
jgi:arylsulfatase